MISLAEFILRQTKEYNGHLQTEINCMSIEDGQQLLKDLQEITDCTVVLELFADGSFCIIQKDYWKKGKHPLKHTDRTLLGVENGA